MMMITRTLLILLCLLPNSFALWAQSTGKTMISVKEITVNPWPFEITPDAIQERYGDYLKKEKYTMKNRFKPTQKDTIIKFSKGKTEIFFYTSFNSTPVFIAANIFDKRIKIKGDISPGITARDFYSRVSYPEANSDTIHISLPDGAFKTSVFLKNDVIRHIKIEARNKNK